MSVPQFFSGQPFEFEVTMPKPVEADAVITVRIMTYRYGVYLNGSSDGDQTGEVSVGPADGTTFGVSVTGEGCRQLALGFVHLRAVVHGANGKLTDVLESVVGEIVTK